MNLPVRSRLGHKIPPWVLDGSFFFITINCEPRGDNQLCREGIGQAVLAAAAHNHEALVWHCLLMLLMPDHLHAVIAFPREAGMKVTITNWKRFLARHQKINWQRDFFDHRLRDHNEETEKISYVLTNPIRRKLCERVEDWSWVYRPNNRLPPSLSAR
jgi:REP element-mobilizing transposase RayT